MEAAVGERTAKTFVKKQKQECHLNTLGGEAVGIAGAVALQQTVALGGNDYWNDSCSVEELRYAISHGAVGATTNPTIVLGVLKKEMAHWREPLHSFP